MIQITPVTKNNARLFAPLFPPAGGAQGDIRLGCVFAGTACGAALLRPLPGGCKLAWFYVAPDFRGRGCGAALLKAALRAFAGTGSPSLSVFYSAQGGSAHALDALFLRFGFALFSESGGIFRLPWDSVREAPILQGDPAAARGGEESALRALGQTPEYCLDQFRRDRRRQDDLLCADADYAGAHPDFSAVCLSAGGAIEGLLLLADFEQNDLWLDLLYAKKAGDIRRLLLYSFRALREAGRTPDAVFCSGDAATGKLVHKLFDSVEAQAVEYHRGLLRAEMRKER
ncbi:MAG: GNAT family N-acetyltransferase [Gracilibacteraceae bacterium]|jgi:GNAT superfamily N-acetyltransferase|nr:GNAT family N-acetyltransferase [Gracilibacteraceae bacterium]